MSVARMVENRIVLKSVQSIGADDEDDDEGVGKVGGG